MLLIKRIVRIIDVYLFIVCFIKYWISVYIILREESIDIINFMVVIMWSGVIEKDVIFLRVKVSIFFRGYLDLLVVCLFFE